MSSRRALRNGTESKYLFGVLKKKKKKKKQSIATTQKG